MAAVMLCPHAFAPGPTRWLVVCFVAVTKAPGAYTRRLGALTQRLGVRTLRLGMATQRKGVVTPRVGALTRWKGSITPAKGATTRTPGVLTPALGMPNAKKTAGGFVVSWRTDEWLGFRQKISALPETLRRSDVECGCMNCWLEVGRHNKCGANDAGIILAILFSRQCNLFSG